MDVCASRGTDAGNVAIASFSSPSAPAAPASVPAAASSRLSISICRTRRAREAPSAARTAISRAAPVARASSSPATFRHAVSSTSADGTEQHEQRRTVVAEHVVQQRHRPRQPAGVGALELGAEPCRSPARVPAPPVRSHPGCSRATASMKCAPRLWRVRSQLNRSHRSTSSGKLNFGGITPAMV